MLNYNHKIIQMTLCPICGFIYDIKYEVINPSVCSICCLNIEIAHIEYINRQNDKKCWHKNMEAVLEEMIPIILHPIRIRWFLPEYI